MEQFIGDGFGEKWPASIARQTRCTICLVRATRAESSVTAWLAMATFFVFRNHDKLQADQHAAKALAHQFRIQQKLLCRVLGLIVRPCTAGRFDTGTVLDSHWPFIREGLVRGAGKSEIIRGLQTLDSCRIVDVN